MNRLHFVLFDVVAAGMGNYSSSTWSTEEVIRRLQPVVSVEVTQLRRSVNLYWYEHDSLSDTSNRSWSEDLKGEYESNYEADGLKTTKYEREPCSTAANGTRSEDMGIEYDGRSETSGLVSTNMADNPRSGD